MGTYGESNNHYGSRRKIEIFEASKFLPRSLALDEVKNQIFLLLNNSKLAAPNRTKNLPTRLFEKLLFSIG